MHARIVCAAAALIVSLGTSAAADTAWSGRPDTPPWSIALRFGLNGSTLSGELGDSKELKTGPNIGVAALVRMSGLLSLQAEVAISRKGVIVDDEDWDYWYIETPLLVRVAPRTRVRPFAIGGSAGAFHLHGEDTREENDLALVLGGGLELDLPQGAAFVELRYSHGLTVVSSEDHHHRVITLSAGYWIR